MQHDDELMQKLMISLVDAQLNVAHSNMFLCMLHQQLMSLHTQRERVKRRCLASTSISLLFVIASVFVVRPSPLLLLIKLLVIANTQLIPT